ncbi:MAG: hypothetical protein SNJ84_05780 [Verrucomicrobiia bacterium]
MRAGDDEDVFIDTGLLDPPPFFVEVAFDAAADFRIELGDVADFHS